MAQYDWLGGSLSDAADWGPQIPNEPPVEPGAADNITINGEGTIAGSVAPESAILDGAFALSGSIASVGTTLVYGAVTLNAGATLAGAGLEIEDSGSVIDKGGSASATYFDIGEGYYLLTEGALKVGSDNEYIGDGGIGDFVQTGGSNTDADDLIIGYGGGSGAYGLSGGTLSAAAEYIGQNSDGSFNQTGGVDTVAGRIVLGINVSNGASGTGTYTLGKTGSLISQTIFIGSDPGCTGIFNFNTTAGDAAKLKVTPIADYPGLIVGGQGKGTFNQGGGAVSTTVAVGYRGGGSGFYNLNNGSLTSTDLQVGSSGTGVFTQKGGTVTVTGSALRVGVASQSNGTYSIRAGTLNGAGETVGDGGTGLFEQEGGSNTISKTDLIVGNGKDSQGTYQLWKGSLIIAKGGLIIGSQDYSNGEFDLNYGDPYPSSGALTIASGKLTVGDAGTGIFNQGGGKLLSGLEIGAITASKGSYLLEGGELTSTNQIQVVGDAGTGTFTQTGGNNAISFSVLKIGNDGGNGTYTLGGNGDLTLTQSSVQLGVAANAMGTFNFNIGVGDAAKFSSIFGDAITVGVGGGGNFVMGGGSVTAKFILGENAAANGVVELDGGAITARGETVGNDGTGTFNEKGGTNTNDLTFSLGYGASGAGAYNLKGGALFADTEDVGYAGSGKFVQSGGTNKSSTGTFLDLDIGVRSKAVGAYSLTDGTLSAETETVGDSGTGAFNQSGGANIISNGLTIGKSGGGTYTLSGGSLAFTRTIAAVSLGAGNGSSGALTVTNATVAVGYFHDGSLGSGAATIGAGAVLKVATSLSIGAGSSLDSTAGAVTIGSGATQQAGSIGIGAGGKLMGAGTVKGAIDELAVGALEASGGVLKLTGAVSGGGTLKIANGATLDLVGADSNAVSFLSGKGTLKIEAAGSFKGEIENLAIGDVIDFANETVAKAIVVGNVLTVTTTGSTYTFNVTGALSNTHFAIKSDTGVGDQITLAKGHVAPAPQVSASELFAPQGSNAPAIGDASPPAWLGAGAGAISLLGSAPTGWTESAGPSLFPVSLPFLASTTLTQAALS